MDYRQIIQQSIDYIEDNLKTDIRPGELAALAGFSRYHYHRLFQSATGMSVMAYVVRRRLLHAICEIGQGSSGVDAALEYGFDTYAGFYKAFQREFGCTPARFLESREARKPCRLNLMQEEHLMITRKKAAQVLRHWGMEGEPVSGIYYEGTGNPNENAYAVGEGYVLKFTANLGKVKNHIALAQALEQEGLRAATAVATLDGRQYVQEGDTWFYLTLRLPGREMAAVALYEGDTAEKAWFVGEMIGRLHLALARVEVPVEEAALFDTVRDWALPGAKEALGLTNGFCEVFLEELGALYPNLPRQIIHRDPNPGNIICDGGEWGFIDFELAQRNARIYDPCYAATAVLSETFGTGEPQRLEQWLEIYRNIFRGYDSIVKLTPQERQAAPWVLLANQMVCVAWFAEQEKYAALLETNRKMTLWLLERMEQLGLE